MTLLMIDILVYTIVVFFILLLVPQLIMFPLRLLFSSKASKISAKNVRYFSVLIIVVMFMLVILIMSVWNIVVGIR